MNKVIGGTIGLVLAAEITNAFYCVMRSALGPCTFLNGSPALV